LFAAWAATGIPPLRAALITALITALFTAFSGAHVGAFSAACLGFGQSGHSTGAAAPHGRAQGVARDRLVFKFDGGHRLRRIFVHKQRSRAVHERGDTGR
jgi:hypothetical protein